MKFKAGDKVWAYSHGLSPRSAPRGWYAAVVILGKYAKGCVTPAYKLDVAGCINPSGTTVWWCNERNMRPRDDDQKEPGPPAADANKKVSWDSCVWRPSGVKA